MMHTNIGTANAMNMLIDAAAVGSCAVHRRPHAVQRAGPRVTARYIHWAQEMYDQGGMLREVVKWDYELNARSTRDHCRSRAEADDGVAEGPGLSLAAARSAWRSRVCIGREQSRASCPAARAGAVGRGYGATRRLDRERASAGRHHQLLGQDPRDAVVLSRLAERWALPVIPYRTRYFAISANHPMFQG